MALNNLEDRLECAIRHINTALDIDPWAQNLAVESMRMRIALMKGPERKRGKWELSSIMHSTPPTYMMRCSECGMETFGVHDFCPNCGAQMEGME